MQIDTKHTGIYTVALLSCLLLPVIMFAETSALYTLSGIPGLDEAAQGVDDSTSFATFINSIYRMSIGLGSALAVIVITISGIQYAMSDAFGVKENMKSRITKAIGGLLLLMGAFIFLEYVNPDLTDLRIEDRKLLDGSRTQDASALNVEEVDSSPEEEAQSDTVRNGPR